jgi:hypothetical protein
LVSASIGNLGTFQKGECVNLLQTCADCTYNNISSVVYPNSSDALGIANMQKTGLVWNYTFCDTVVAGTYTVNGHGDLGGVDTIWNYNFLVTENGNAEPGGAVIVFFVIVFLILIATFGLFIIATLDGFKDLDFTVRDVLLNWAIYFVLIGTYLLGKQYLGNSFINNFLETALKITGITNVFMPLIAFIMSITVGDLRRRKEQFK